MGYGLGYVLDPFPQTPEAALVYRMLSPQCRHAGTQPEFLPSPLGARGMACVALGADGGQTMAMEYSSKALAGGTQPWHRAAQVPAGSTQSSAG